MIKPERVLSAGLLKTLQSVGSPMILRRGCARYLAIVARMQRSESKASEPQLLNVSHLLCNNRNLAIGRSYCRSYVLQSSND